MSDNPYTSPEQPEYWLDLAQEVDPLDGESVVHFLRESNEALRDAESAFSYDSLDPLSIYPIDIAPVFDFNLSEMKILPDAQEINLSELNEGAVISIRGNVGSYLIYSIKDPESGAILLRTFLQTPEGLKEFFEVSRKKFTPKGFVVNTNEDKQNLILGSGEYDLKIGDFPDNRPWVLQIGAVLKMPYFKHKTTSTGRSLPFVNNEPGTKEWLDQALEIKMLNVKNGISNH